MSNYIIVMTIIGIVGVLNFWIAEWFCRVRWNIYQQHPHHGEIRMHYDEDRQEAIELTTEKFWLAGLDLEEAKTRALEEIRAEQEASDRPNPSARSAGTK